jgi:site-specific DNA-cytosine methylase
MGYVFRECLLAPFNFGVPNDRLRYFIMARLRSSFELGQQQHTAAESGLQSTIFDPETEPIYTTWPFPAFVEDPKKTLEQHLFTLPEIRHFLDKEESHSKEYLLPRQLILERPNFRFGK